MRAWAALPRSAAPFPPSLQPEEDSEVTYQHSLLLGSVHARSPAGCCGPSRSSPLQELPVKRQQLQPLSLQRALPVKPWHA